MKHSCWIFLLFRFTMHSIKAMLNICLSQVQKTGLFQINFTSRIVWLVSFTTEREYSFGNCVWFLSKFVSYSISNRHVENCEIGKNQIDPHISLVIRLNSHPKLNFVIVHERKYLARICLCILRNRNKKQTNKYTNTHTQNVRILYTYFLSFSKWILASDRKSNNFQYAKMV